MVQEVLLMSGRRTARLCRNMGIVLLYYKTGKYGQFGTWETFIDQVFGLPDSTARNYTDAAEFIPEVQVDTYSDASEMYAAARSIIRAKKNRKDPKPEPKSPTQKMREKIKAQLKRAMAFDKAILEIQYPTPSASHS